MFSQRYFQNECTLTIKMVELKVSFKCDGLGVLRKKQWGTLFKSIVNDELNKQKLFTHNHNFKLDSFHIAITNTRH